MDILRKYWGHGLVGIFALIVISELPYFHGQPMLTPADGETPLSQVDRDIRDTLDTLSTSANIRDWKMSGFTPSDIISNTLVLKRSDAKASLCTALGNLQDADLAVFEVALQSPQSMRQLPCSHAMIDKIRAYWSAQIEAGDQATSHAEAHAVPSITHAISKDSAREVNSELLSNGEFALVFEGSLDPILTREILKILDERDAKATFLVPGSVARENADLMEMIVKTGNSAGSEGAEIRDLTLLAMNDAERSVVDGANSVDIATGAHSGLFAFPLNSSNEMLETFVSSKGLKPLKADIDSADWKTFDAARLTASLRSEISAHKKGIILLHSNLHQTTIALPAILDELASQQHKLVNFEIK